MQEQEIYHKEIFDYLAGNLSSSKCEEVEKWIVSSPENKQNFENLKTFWDLEPMGPVKHKWEEFISMESGSRQIESQHKFQLFIKIAAVFVAFLVLSTIVYIYNKKDVYLSGNDMHACISLPDGSVIYLNKQTTVTWPAYFFSQRRYINLSGEAFFEVMQLDGRNFKVQTKNILVEVLGTKFNVKSYPLSESDIITVQSGKVKVSDNNGKLSNILVAGEKVEFKSELKKFVGKSKIGFENQNYKLRQLEFNDTPVDQVVRSISEFYGVELEIADASVVRFKITAIFVSQPIDSVLATLNRKLYFRVKGEGPFIKKR